MSFQNISPKILLVKLSSLGDVLHNLPIIWDLRARLPNAQIDWVVEEAYVGLLTPLLSRAVSYTHLTLPTIYSV